MLESNACTPSSVLRLFHLLGKGYHERLCMDGNVAGCGLIRVGRASFWRGGWQHGKRRVARGGFEPRRRQWRIRVSS